MNVAKGQAKYKLGDDSNQSKFGRETFSIVPSGTADFNLWFYPVEGVQMPARVHRPDVLQHPVHEGPDRVQLR